MPMASIQNFSGIMPMRDRSVLPDNASGSCTNAYLYGGSVRGFGKANSVYTLKSPATKSVYRVPLTNPNDFVDSLWLESDDPFRSVIRAPMIEDSFKRYYFFPSDQAPNNFGPQYNTLANLRAGAPGLTLGIPNPTVAPTVSYTGGTITTQEVRAYVYTWQSAYNEEGPPSPPATLKGTVDGTWQIGLTAPSVAQLANRSITSVNIYRTVTDSTGVAEYYLVATIPIAQLTFIDVFRDTDITSNQTMNSSTWTAPPADLQGVVTMANGILAGWSNQKEIWFCEPYRPHAWPSGYALTVDAPIVALAAIGSSLVILTENTPSVASGVTPAQMTIGKISSREPCISRGSVAPAGEGVYYASPNGLILVNTLGTTNVTQMFVSKENWESYSPETFRASKYAMAYMAFSSGSLAVNNGIIIDHVAMTLMMSRLSFGQQVSTVYCDELSGSTFIVTATQVYEWSPSAPSALLPYVWESKDWRFPYAEQFVGGVVYFDIPPTLTIPTPTAATRNTSQAQDLDPTKQYLLLKVYADESLVLVREIQKSGELIMFPSGFTATYWRFRFEGQVNIKEAKFATSVKELMKI